ncbi:MAG: glutaredoxin [Candidatus Aenigmarchaeota archaeon]|nr:glutaredoxin [Candidatus Aenigmarchaeota archaeon]
MVVRLYSRSGEASAEIRALLRANGIGFTEYDIDRYPSLKKEALSGAKGGDFPIVYIDGKAVFGNNVVKDLRRELGIKRPQPKIVSGFLGIKKRIESVLPASPVRRKPWEYLEPRTFEVGVTSGLPSIDRATLVEEAMNSIGKGCDVMRLDVESHNHLTPKDKDDLKALADAQGMKWAIHADLTIDLTVSEKTHWEYVEKSLKAYIKFAKDINAVYVNVHASVYETPALRPAISRAYELHVDPDGKDIKELFEQTKEAQRWYVEEETRNIQIYQVVRYFHEKWAIAERLKDEEYNKKMGELNAKSDTDKIKAYQDDLTKDLLRTFDSRITEWFTYNIVAWSMYKKRDPIWRSICGDTTPGQLVKSDKQDDLIKLVDAVSGAYVRGHFQKHLENMEKDNVIFVLENPDARGGNYKGQLQHRLMHPTNIYHVVRAIGSPYLRMSIDFEHIAMQGYDVWKEVEKFPNDIGEWVLNFDVNSHPNVNHLQHPVERGDIFLYKLLWEVRKRGLKRAYLMYEWGGGRKPEERWLESVPALKMIAKMLESDIAPDDLPPEFFGVGPAEIELEKRIMERNTFKPLEGTLEFPELAWGWFSGELKKKGKLEQWAKEEYR